MLLTEADDDSARGSLDSVASGGPSDGHCGFNSDGANHPHGRLHLAAKRRQADTATQDWLFGGGFRPPDYVTEPSLARRRRTTQVPAPAITVRASADGSGTAV